MTKKSMVRLGKSLVSGVPTPYSKSIVDLHKSPTNILRTKTIGNKSFAASLIM